VSSSYSKLVDCSVLTCPQDAQKFRLGVLAGACGVGEPRSDGMIRRYLGATRIFGS